MMARPGAGRLRVLAGVLALASALLAGCATRTDPPSAGSPWQTERWVLDPGYYWQSAAGHLAILRTARPISEWLAHGQTPESLRERLALAQRLRAFASDELHLPRNASYSRYADLGRRAVVWNVVAAPVDGLELHTWCYAFAGCLGYRGYYDEAQAHAFAATLAPESWDVAVYPVPAYSTLGWMNWAGGDPLLSTFIGYPEGELARLLFHELAHQVVHVSGDTVFNESYATAVERLGGQRWLDTRADAAARAEYAAFDARRQAFRSLMRETRMALKALYADPPAHAEAKARNKREILAAFQARYAELKAGWGGYAGYDVWAAQANNALFAVQAAYDELVPGFEALFEREGRDFARFHAAVRKLARQPQAERHRQLRALTGATG